MERKIFEDELAPFCLEHDVGVINYYGLAAGFLTGKYRSEADLGKSQRGAGAKKYLNERGMRVLAALDEVAARLGATSAQMALAWLIAQPSVTAPIASATDLDQLAELVKAANLRLDEAALAALNDASLER
jgi:aryl-alcohol dehydrogenase-like predicted oxidoreductase